MAAMENRSRTELDALLPEIRRSPSTDGPIELIVRRPEVSGREELDEAALDVLEGLVGDCWRSRGSSRTTDGTANPGMQLTLMNARVAAAVAGDRHRWSLAGDQVYVDLDLSHTNLPIGTRLALGSALIDVTDQPHTGCAKFTQRFGLDAMRFVNSPEGLELRLRGMNTRVVAPGRVRVGEKVRAVRREGAADAGPGPRP